MIFFPLVVTFLIGDVIAAYLVPAHFLVWVAVGLAAGMAWIVYEGWRISR